MRIADGSRPYGLELASAVGASRQPAQAAESRRLEDVRRAVGPDVDAISVRLPQLDQGIRHGLRRAVEDSDPQPNPLARGVVAGEAAEPRLISKAEVKERTDRLRRCRHETSRSVAHAKSIIHN